MCIGVCRVAPPLYLVILSNGGQSTVLKSIRVQLAPGSSVVNFCNVMTRHYYNVCILVVYRCSASALVSIIAQEATLIVLRLQIESDYQFIVFYWLQLLSLLPVSINTSYQIVYIYNATCIVT